MIFLHLPATDRRDVLVRAGRALGPGGTLIVLGHDRANLAKGIGGPQDPDVLYGPPDVVDDLRGAGVALALEQADTITRPVEGADRPALDCLVRARRTA